MIKGFADIVIADITAGQINHYFAEIAPCTVYPLYGVLYSNVCLVHQAFGELTRAYALYHPLLL